MKKPMLLVLIGAILVSAIITGFLFLRGNEDTWICQSGQWIAHGTPSSAQPTSGCGEEQMTETSTETTLPNVPNGLFDEVPSATLTCNKEVQMHELMQPIFASYFTEVKTRPCGTCDKNPICVRYIPKFKFTALDVNTIQSQLLSLGYKQYDEMKRDLATDKITFGMLKNIDNKPLGIFFSFSLSNQEVRLITEL